MAKRSEQLTELELRVDLARQRDERDQKHARSLCAVDSEHCRAGDEWEWFDVTSGSAGRTYCFCPAHALAAELLGGSGFFFDAVAAPVIIDRIREIEKQRDAEKRNAG